MNQPDKLTDLLAEFARTLGSDFRIQDILERLVTRIVEVLPVTGAGVMLMGTADELHFVAASNDAILAIESLQNELGEGPCLEAYRSGEAVSVPDIGLDQRFSTFSPRASEAGLAAVFTFPMSLDGARFGALDLYRDASGDLDPADLRAAQILADVAAAYIHNARGRADAVDTLDLMRLRSLHDPLTGLPNRTLLKERLEHAVARATRTGELVSVLFVDLDRFKAVNDEFGHHVGDLLLVAVARRLSKVLRMSDTLARLAGDEFVILCEGMEKAELAEHVAGRIADAMRPAFHLQDQTVNVTASVGIAFAGTGADLPESLLRDADFAMYQAKQAGGAQHQVLDPAARLVAERRGRLGRELRVALNRKEFQLAYQPLVDIHDGRLLGLEALLRWRHPTRGWVMPQEILPIAEPTGLILEIGEWVLMQACQDLKRWQQTYRSAIPNVSVNVSPYQIMAPGFDTTVSRVLETTGTDPKSLFLEVTESAFLEDGPRALAVLRQIKEIGVGLSLDDFGTGYSSLNYLRRFPFDVLKIDQAFITGLAADDGTREIVTAIIDLAHGLNLAVVAEGVETEQQRALVSRLGSDQGQGFHFCRPMLVDQLDHRILEPAGAAPIRLPLTPYRPPPFPGQRRRD